VWRYYLQAPLLWYDDDEEDGAVSGPCRQLSGSAQLAADLGEVGWRWLREACKAAGALPFKTTQLWAGHGGGVTPCHYDALHNFLAQLRGSKMLLLLPPSESYKLYPYPVPHLPVSPRISPYLSVSPHLSPALPSSPQLSPSLPLSRHLPPYLPLSPPISYRPPDGQLGSV